MSEPRRVLVVGATGLVGSEIMRLRTAARGVRLVGLARRLVSPAETAGAETIVADPATWQDAVADFAPEAVISALGTTWRKAGRSEAAFRAVDHDLVLSVAGAARAAGASRFVAVSAVGADPASRAFYLRIKGEVEVALAGLGFARLDLLQPGLLRGPRGGDRRWGERIGILASPLVDRVLRGPWRRYRSIPARDVAAATLALLDEQGEGHIVHEHQSILRLADRLDAPR